MRTIVIDGNLGRDCEIRTSRDGRKYVSFSFANKVYDGQEKSEWFDATCYDPYVVDKQAKYLTKGTYVKITGTFRSDVSVKDGKVYLNQYVRVWSIEYGGNGNGKKNENEGNAASTYTGGTPSIVTENLNQPQAPSPAPAQPTAPVAAPVEEPSVTTESFNDTTSDDLPF